MSARIILLEVEESTPEKEHDLLYDPALLLLMNQHGLHWSDMQVIDGEIHNLYTAENKEAL